MHVLQFLPHTNRNFSCRTFVQADTTRFARGYAALLGYRLIFIGVN
jgi:hypothetical protein